MPGFFDIIEDLFGIDLEGDAGGTGGDFTFTFPTAAQDKANEEAAQRAGASKVRLEAGLRTGRRSTGVTGPGDRAGFNLLKDQLLKV